VEKETTMVVKVQVSYRNEECSKYELGFDQVLVSNVTGFSDQNRLAILLGIAWEMATLMSIS
jgi:hypothetical protein